MNGALREFLSNEDCETVKSESLPNECMTAGCCVFFIPNVDTESEYIIDYDVDFEGFCALRIPSRSMGRIQIEIMS